MDLGRIIGSVVAQRKSPSLEGVQLCILQPLNQKLEPVEEPLIASEASRSCGLGEIVFYVASGDAVYTHPDGRAMPVDAAIVGKVEAVNL